MYIPKYFLAVILLSLCMVCGCASTCYHWYGYDESLYGYYKHPDIGKLQSSLESTIQRGEKDNRIPPGIYAEYGYVLYESGRYNEAIEFFKKEQEHWPESAVLMQKMIRNAQMLSNNTGTKGKGLL